MKRFALPLLALLVLAGCSAPVADTAASVEAVTPVPIASAPTAPPSDPSDITAEVKAVAPDLESYVVSATVTEPGRVTIESSLVDPRGEDGSPEALLAIQLCNDVVGLGEISHVSIMEKDGTTWILYGHPSYGNTCTEV